jgi:hypothetical protein
MYERATRFLYWSLAIAVAVSVVHYVDNYANYANYPVPAAGSGLPAPSKSMVGLSWFVFTFFGAVAVVMWRRRRIVGAALSLVAYSASGLVGLAHYAVPGATSMARWRQGHVVMDIVCGLVLCGFALWAVARAADLRTPDHGLGVAQPASRFSRLRRRAVPRRRR